ncbi:MAG: hypothetical protein MI923_09645 [Phycisphaerales bacterium]|nr:hypothetical protein [Phycisphaerales bacterium]
MDHIAWPAVSSHADVLVVDSGVAEELKGKLIDVEQTNDGARLVAR